MNELERLRALISGASTATDRESALAYVAAAKAVGKKLDDELRQMRAHLEAIEKRAIGAAVGETLELGGGGGP